MTEQLLTQTDHDDSCDVTSESSATSMKADAALSDRISAASLASADHRSFACRFSGISKSASKGSNARILGRSVPIAFRMVNCGLEAVADIVFAQRTKDMQL